MTRLPLAVLMLVGGSAFAASRVALIAPGVEPPVERALLEALQKLPSVQVVNLQGGKLTSSRAGAQRFLNVESAHIGDGRVLYLQVVDAASGQASSSASATLGGGAGELSAADRGRVRAALVRVLDPDRFRGRLALKVDVPNAEVQIDGKRQGSLSGPLELPVGTHALRVTHPQYHDFLRFVDIEFDQTVTLAVALSAYPLAEGEMSEKLRKQTGPKKRLPWWRTFWALGLAGVVLTGATVGVVLLARPGVSADKTVSYQALPGP